jgi:hypothetical protein
MFRIANGWAPGVGFGLVGALSLALAACGAGKPAEDPSQKAGETPPTEDPPTKWEGATPQPSATATGGGAPKVNEGTARRSDEYDKEATEVVLRRAGRQVKDNCGFSRDDDGKLVGPWGKATIKVMLGRNGHSKGVTIPPPFEGKPTGKCIAQAFSNLTFPPWAGQDTQIDWDVDVIQPPDSGKPAPKKP